MCLKDMPSTVRRKFKDWPEDKRARIKKTLFRLHVTTHEIAKLPINKVFVYTFKSVISKVQKF